jgi:hypothetical protein
MREKMAAKLFDLVTGFRPEISCPGLGTSIPLQTGKKINENSDKIW